MRQKSYKIDDISYEKKKNSLLLMSDTICNQQRTRQTKKSTQTISMRGSCVNCFHPITQSRCLGDAT